MHIKRFLFWVAYTALIASTLSGCISFHRAYIQISGIRDLDLAYRQVNGLISNSEFKQLAGKDKSKFENIYYAHQIIEHYTRGNLRREFSIAVWRDTETEKIFLIFGEANVGVFSTEGRMMFDKLIQKMQVTFGESNVTYGKDEKTLDVLWKRLHSV